MLALVPAAVLVVVLLTSLAVDAAATFIAQRELADACLGAANDAATIGLSERSIYGEGTDLVIDPAAARVIVVARVRELAVRWGHEVEVDITPVGDAAILDLSLRAEAPVPVGAGAGPWAGRRRAVRAACQVTVRRR